MRNLTEIQKFEHAVSTIEDFISTMSEMSEKLEKRLFHGDISEEALQDKRRFLHLKTMLKSEMPPSEFKALFELLRLMDRKAKRSDLVTLLMALTYLEGFGIYMKILKLEFEALRKQLVDSKILEKAKTIEDIEKLQKRLQAVYKKAQKAQKSFEESKKKDLYYVR